MMSAITDKSAPVRRKAKLSESAFGIATLLLTVLVVHGFDTLVVRPRAVASLAQATAMKEAHERQTSLRSIFVIIKDPEQETAMILAVWATLLIIRRWRAAQRDRALLELPFMESNEGLMVLPQDVRTWKRQIESVAPESQQHLLPRALKLALDRFEVTRSVHETAAAVTEECQSEAMSLDADNSMLRFVVWGIPAVGFVGTARGIGNALQDAQSALMGDISGVTVGLGITFNSTLTALTLCLLIMFLLHQLQHVQDRVVLDTKNFIEQRLVARLRLG
jgi:biopolymer transport protein ExbB/TolQ